MLYVYLREREKGKRESERVKYKIESSYERCVSYGSL